MWLRHQELGSHITWMIQHPQELPISVHYGRQQETAAGTGPSKELERPMDVQGTMRQPDNGGWRKQVVQMRNWTTRRNKVILAGFLMTEETSLQLGELRNEEWGGGKACCFQLLSWFSFSLKMYLNSSRQEAGARLSFYHAAYSVFTNPCSPKILAIIIQLQGTYLFTALLCITTCPQGSTSERKRRRKEQRMNEIIIISWFMKGCFFSVVFV